MIPRLHRTLVLLLLTAGSLLGAAFYAAVLPARVPIHWNASGRADGFGGAWIDAFLLPAGGWLLMGLMILLPLLRPFRSTFDRFGRVYGRICVTTAALWVAIQTTVLLAAAGKPVPVANLLTAAAGLAIAVVANWLGKARRNALVGFRTPWTLADDQVWERTNRLGARIALIFGVTTFVAGIVAPPLIGVAIVLGGAVSLGAWAMIYSRWLYRARAAGHRG